MQDGSAANQSVCLWERSLPSEKHWTVLHSIKPRCDVKCKVGCWAGLRHPLSVFFCLCGAQLYQTKGFFFFFFTAEQNIHRQGTQSSEEALCIQVQPCLFVFSVRRASALVSAVIRLFLLVLLLLCSEQVWDLRSWQEVLRDCLFAWGQGRLSLWWRCGVRVVCAGTDEETHLPRVSNSTPRAALLSSNKQRWKFSTNTKSVVRVH